ncbi:unnamed protein product [Meloidogyne enterolobii]|uniref:Uncharacterized protein n=1 Tax=Meloidogyne enterolobii TaxID=390850 RepID=A0ACB1ACM2_MELEN
MKDRINDIAQLFLNNKQFKDWLNKSQELSVPLLLVGDFNTPSHQDWIEETKQSHYGRVIEWPTTKILTEAGFIDTFRALNNPLEEPGSVFFEYQSEKKSKGPEKLRIRIKSEKGSE